MNRNDFITEIKKNIAQMNSKEIENCFVKFVKEFASDRKEEAIDFLQSFLVDSRNKIEPQNFIDQMTEQTLEEKMKKMEEWLELMEEGELYLTADGYDDYGWGSDWIWEYHDNSKVAEKIMIIIEFAKTCMNNGKYTQAASLFSRLVDLEIWVENEWDDFTVDLSEMEEEDLIELDLEEFALMVLYTEYQVQEAENRAEQIYSYFCCPIFRDIHIEDIWKFGKETLKEEELFWKDWIELLSSRKGATERKLLKEAVLYKEGREGLVKIAEKCYECHPELYLDALIEYEKDQKYQNIMEIGTKAVELIDKKVSVRSQIAMQTARAYYYMQNKQKMKEFWYEAYVSDRSELNYLRLFLDEELASSYGKKARDIQKDQIEDSFLFLFGEFEKAKNACINPERSLGWSGKFIRLGVKLFLLYFYQEKQLKTAIGTIAKEIADEFGFHNNQEFYFLEDHDFKQTGDDKNTFWMAFYKWRNYFPMEEEKKKTYLLWIEDIIEQRTKAIVGGQFRAHYGSVACLIIALGEIKESMGLIDAKQNLWLEYKQMFPRHTAFHGAMRSLMS